MELSTSAVPSNGAEGMFAIFPFILWNRNKTTGVHDPSTLATEDLDGREA